MFEQMENTGLERLHFAQDPDSGLKAIIAIHSTLRGPAIGGCRFIPYRHEADAITDAARLARGMSYKAALAGLPHGGGKAVIIQPEGPFDRARLMRAFGRFVEDIGGRYITAMDSGTQVSDMDAIATATRWVTCTSAMGDPSPHTAAGVVAGIRASLRYRLGRESPRGSSCALQGLGHVGFNVARLLHRAGVRLIVADVDHSKVARAVTELGATAVAPEEIYAVDADVFCPCGLGAIINDDTVAQLRCKVIAGSANNQLQREEHGEQLQQRGILYAPDYLINAGGLIFVALRHAGRSAEEISAKIETIGQSLITLYRQAEKDARPIHRIANAHAEAILAQAGRLHPAA